MNQSQPVTNAARVAGQNDLVSLIRVRKETHLSLGANPIKIGRAVRSDSDAREVDVYEMDGGQVGKWSNSQSEPPKIGSRVKVNFNGFGAGEVSHYFIENGWLGVYVRLDKQPDWHKKQNGAAKLVMVFGAELTSI